ncbi:MAG: sigma-70 family RNA polymerase sigma factor [Planctomycetes bacterium]|jgi:RNA polymerase sigma-70 factor (ECF subfamily)|nr:sigma-70 family RNA polymerase sigma factor [Planctomycetota bacterium]
MDLEATFQQFCRSRDPAALGAVFDACADDLFGLALHLTRDHTMAEDVLQATFVCAIERAGSWQPNRPLRPWLLGILHREVKVARRRSRRAPDATRVAVARDDGPETVVLAAEVRDAVQRAIVELPEPYRAVLDLHLVQTLPPTAIALRLQRSSGSVRTQLWRGLELLRQRLPQGLAIGLAAAATAQAPLAAVRARVLAAAAGSGAVPAGAALALGVIMKKVLVAAFVLLAGLIAWQLRPFDPGAITATAPTATTAVAEAPGAAASVARVAADSGDPRAAAQAAPLEPAGPTPIALPVRVLDLAGAAIAGVEVEGFVAKVPQLPDGRPVEPNGRDACVRQFVATTDAEGRVRVTLTGPTLLSARQTGVGWSGDRLVRTGTRRLPDELLLVLQPTGMVRGRVLHADGRPAAGARVEASLADGPFEILGPPAVVADVEGRFVLEGIAGADWIWDHSLIAVLGSEYSRARKLVFQAGVAQEVELHFDGAFVVRGVLVDEHGAPSAGRVRLQGKPGTETQDTVRRGECGDDGRFEFPLDGGGSFWLVGGCEGKAPAVASIEIDAARPEQVVQLRMAPLAPVHGRVVDERGQPLAGRMVAVEPELLLAGRGEDAVAAACMSMQCDVLGGFPRPTSDADGRFRALVPPGWRCRALTAAVPGSRELWSRSEPFLTPATDVQLVVRAQDAEGLVLTGRVVADADGAPIPSANIERVRHDERNWSGQDVGQVQAGAFRIGPLARTGGTSFAFSAEGFARTVVGPFDLGARELDLVVRLPRCGGVRCRVLRANGTPAASAWVVLVREDHDAGGPAWQGATEGDGWYTFDDVEPVPMTVHAWASREGSFAEVAAATATVVVRPQQVGEVVVQLAR